MLVGLDGSLAQINPPERLFTKMIDKAAQSLVDIFKRTQPPLDEESVRRFSCYTAVSGKSKYMALSDESSNLYYILIQLVLLEVDANNYFPFLSITGTDPAPQYRISSPVSKRSGFDLDLNLDTTMSISKIFPVQITVAGIQPGFSQVKRVKDHIEIISKRRRFKIAYLILIDKTKERLIAMLTHLHSQDAIFLIHVDRNYPELQLEIQRHIHKFYKESNNVHLFETPFYLQW